MRGGVEVALAYLLACAAFVAIVTFWIQVHPLLSMLVGHVAATLVIFAFSVARNNSSFFDAYWSVLPLPTVLWLAWLGHQSGHMDPLRAAMVIALVFAWGARLTYNWWRGWTGLDHEDWRYVDLRNKTGPLYWVVSLLGLHLFPALLVYGGCVALWPALVTGEAPANMLDGLAAFITAGAIWIEATADRQLWRWRQSKPEPSAYMREGLWSWSRHPNYFGETSFWWGLFVFALAARASHQEPVWWAIGGAVAMTALFLFISIPMMERRTLKKRPAYAEHKRRTSMFVPLPPRR